MSAGSRGSAPVFMEQRPLHAAAVWIGQRERHLVLGVGSEIHDAPGEEPSARDPILVGDGLGIGPEQRQRLPPARLADVSVAHPDHRVRIGVPAHRPANAQRMEGGGLGHGLARLGRVVRGGPSRMARDRLHAGGRRSAAGAEHRHRQRGQRSIRPAAAPPTRRRHHYGRLVARPTEAPPRTGCRTPPISSAEPAPVSDRNGASCWTATRPKRARKAPPRTRQ